MGRRNHRGPAQRADGLGVGARIERQQCRFGDLQERFRRPGHRRHRRNAGRSSRWRYRGDDRQTVRQGAGAAGSGPSALLQADHGNRPSHPERSKLRPDPASSPPAGEAAEGIGGGATRKDRVMRANCWMGKNDVRVQQVPDPKILSPDDAIVRITSTAICGSDLHLYNGFIPSMEKGDILGHEFMGEVVEVGKDVKKLKIGDRVVVPFPIACGHCLSCESHLYAVCENSNPNAWMAEKLWGYSPAGLFGYSHLLGGYAGGQAEDVRGPYADVGPLKVPEGLSDEQVLFLSDILPTGYMGAEMCELTGGETVAVWGAG